jgi:Flp pilus assembly protein TadG
LLRDTRANTMVLMAISLLALATATGVGLDFARGLSFKTALQGAVDAAAIAGASVYLNNGYAADATTAATNYMTKAQTTLPTNNGVTSNIVVSNSAPWTVTVTASASINSSFNGVIRNNIPVTVTATGHGPTNPNIDFYLLLDSSPSMAIAATQSGINSLVNLTTGWPNGYASCGFGCHEQNPNTNHYSGGTELDLYQLARNNNITLRIDNLRAATQSLMTTAATTEASNSAAYRVAIYTYDYAIHTIRTLTSSLSTARTAAGNISLLQVYSNNCLTSSCTSGTAGTNDTDTDLSKAMSSINTTMPDPGGGSTGSGDTPQEVLMLVTDGVEDKIVNSCAAGYSCVAAGSKWRQQSMIDTSWCDTVKNRGIRIALLYTVYYPLPTNSWYNTYISPFQSQIGPKLKSCASPGLYFEVDTGGDITAAMTALFTSAVQSAYISN